jgi:hypothetical protein
MATIKLHDILWQTKNAGASPDDNRRTELYFAGCLKALSGHPCPNCFNPALWDSSKHIPHKVDEIVNVLDMHKIPKHITIVGGEPTDQIEGLIELIPLLKQHGYETILFSWHDPRWIYNHLGVDVLNSLSYVVCGPYDETRRIYDTSKDDGIHNVIGSDNQIIFAKWDKNHFHEYPVSELEKIEYPYAVFKNGSKEHIDGREWSQETKTWIR